MKTSLCLFSVLFLSCLSPVSEGVGDAGVALEDAGGDGCDGFLWSAGTLAGRNSDGHLAAKSISVFGDGWFEMVLNSGVRFRGVKHGVSVMREERAPAGLILVLPDVQRGVHFGVGGIANGCTLTRRIRSLSGPFQATTVDVSKDWDFEVVAQNGTVQLAF